MNALPQDMLLRDYTQEQRAIAEVAFALGERYAARAFDDHEASMAQWSDLCDTGMTALSIPNEYGGDGGMFELCILAERLAAGGYPAAKLVIATAIAGSIIARNGSAQQRERWLPSIAAGTTKFCFALTEPGAGSNTRKLRTRATRQDGRWRIRGEKTFISALESSDAMLVVALDHETGKLLVFALPLPNDAVAVQRVAVEAPAFEYQWSVFFDDLELDDDDLIGGTDGGDKALFDGLNPERLVVAGQAIGIGRWCLGQASAYARQREVFDVPIGAHQAVQHPLAEAYIQIEGAWALTVRAAQRYDAGDTAGLEANVAKIAACDAGLFAADRGLQTFGGAGYTTDTGMLQRFTYMRLLRSIPVAREIALNHVARSALRLPRSH
jgi:alkylation response protein AidB-like acyl-CoA dehydrogenase